MSGTGGRVRGFGELEAVIMDRLWTWGGTATVRDVVDSLQPDRNSAYTTVMTVMDNLYHKGSLTRERDGSPAHDMVFTHFVEHMTDEESQTLRAALRRLSRKRRA